MASEAHSLPGVGILLHTFGVTAPVNALRGSVDGDDANAERQYEAIVSTARHFHHYVYVNLAASTPLGAVLIYLIAVKSPRGMAFCQWLLVNSTLSGYAIVAAIAMWQPVPLNPPFAGFCLGPLRFTDSATSNIPFKVIYVMAYNLSSCYFVGFCYQYASATQTFNQRRRPVGNIAVDQRWRKRIYALFGVFYALFGVGLVLVMHYGVDGINATPEKLRRIANVSGALATLLLRREPTLTSFSSRNRWSLLLAAMTGIWIVLLIGMSVGLNWKFLRLLKGSRQALPLTAVTRNLQIMLCRTFMVKTMILFVSIYLPILIVYVSMTFRVDDLRLHFVGLVFISTHAPLSYVHTILFFRPYRRHLCAVLRERCGLKAAPPFVVTRFWQIKPDTRTFRINQSDEPRI